MKEINEILFESGFLEDEFSYIQSSEGLICHLEYSFNEVWKNNSFEISFEDFTKIQILLEKIKKKLQKNKIEYKDFNLVFKNNKDNLPNLFLRIVIVN